MAYQGSAIEFFVCKLEKVEASASRPAYDKSSISTFVHFNKENQTGKNYRKICRRTAVREETVMFRHHGGTILDTHWNPLVYHSTMVPRGLRGHLN